MKSSVSKIKNIVESLSCRLDQIGDRISGLKDKADVLKYADEGKIKTKKYE
jgi:hypothetical protein